jgi:hypothetical protein
MPYGTISIAKSSYASSGVSIEKYKPIITILGIAWFWLLLIALTAIIIFFLLLCCLRWLFIASLDGISKFIKKKQQSAIVETLRSDESDDPEDTS